MEPKRERPGSTEEMTTNEYRRENQQGSAQVESTEINANENLHDIEPVATNDVDPDTQSGRVPGSPMDPAGLAANRSGADIKEQAMKEWRQRRAA